MSRNPVPQAPPILLLLSFLGIATGLAQSPVPLPANQVPSHLDWRWSNPSPFGNNLTDLTWKTNLYYAAACDHGRLFTSTNLTHWILRETGTLKALRAATFLGSRLVITGEAGTVLWADDPSQITTLELPTDNWLEGVAASSNLVVAVGDHGSLFSSPDAQAWTPRTSTVTNWLRSVAWGGGTFVAVGEDGTVLSSTDGTSWTRRRSGTSAHLNRVAYTGTGFIAVGASGTAILGNARADSWSSGGNTGVTGALNAIAVDAFGAPIIAGENAVRLRVGNQWSDELNPNRPPIVPPPIATYLSAVWNGQEIVLGARNGVIARGTRVNSGAGFAFSWTHNLTSTRAWLWDIGRWTVLGTNTSIDLVDGQITHVSTPTTNAIAIAVGESGTLLQSDNGADWLPALGPAFPTTPTYLGVGGRDDVLVAVGSGGTIAASQVAYEAVTNVVVIPNLPAPGGGTTNVVIVLTNYVNTLGLTWSRVTSPTTADLQGIAGSRSLLVAAGDAGTILTSADATTWTPRKAPRVASLSSVAAFPGGFVITGDSGTALASSDGIAWSDFSPARAEWIYKVRWLGTQLVAVGEHGLILTSPDGRLWTPRESGVTNWLTDIAQIEDALFAVGTQGRCLVSRDAGIRWTPVDTVTGRSLYGATAIGGRLVTVGTDGAILRAQAGAWPSPVRFVDYPARPEESLFLLNGYTDQRFRVDRARTLDAWELGTEFEITSPDGVFLLFDDTPNDPARQFYRAVTLP